MVLEPTSINDIDVRWSEFQSRKFLLKFHFYLLHVMHYLACFYQSFY